jgi:hypothetical protein
MRNDMFYLLVCYVSVNIPQFTDIELKKLIFKSILLRQLGRESDRQEKLARSARINSVGSVMFLLPADESRLSVMQ